MEIAEQWRNYYFYNVLVRLKPHLPMRSFRHCMDKISIYAKFICVDTT